MLLESEKPEKKKRKAIFSRPKKEKKPKAEKTEPKPLETIIDDLPKKAPELKKEKIKKPRKALKRIAKVLVILFLAISSTLLLFSGAVYAYHSEFENTAFWGTKILGVDVGGKNKTEIQRILKSRVAKISFNFVVDGQNVEATPEMAGVTFEVGGTAETAVEKGKTGNYVQKLSSITSSMMNKVSPKTAKLINKDIENNVEIKYKIDDEKLNAFTKTLSERFNEDSKNAALVMRGTEVEVIPAVYGRKIVADSIKYQIAEAIKKTDTESIKIDIEKVNPQILETETKVSIDEAKAILSLPVTLTYKGKSYTPDKVTVGSWIVFNERDVEGKKKLVPEASAARVYSYVHSLAGQINVPVVNKKVTVKNGGEQVVEREGQDGLAVDVDSISANIARTLNEKKAVALEISTYAVKFKTEVNNIIVADWSKYIEVNLSTQTMRAYEAGGVVVGSWSVTTGQDGMSTPVGTHLIIRKSGEGGAPGSGGGGVCMPNPPSPYPLCGINYVSTFTSAGHAIHEAWWRSSFGGQDYHWNGSHGCVNATYDIASFIFYWAPIGTPVIVHY